MSYETLPEASASRVYDYDISSAVLPQCHGCGNFFPADQLKKCTRCQRVHYCSKSCQKMDWVAPRFHKKSCQPGLLDIAMNNLPQLSMEEKVKLGVLNLGSDNKVPNNNINQTINQVSCENISEILDAADKEIRRIGRLSLMPKEDIEETPGHNREEHVNYKYGLDDGVETLCLALNLWPGVATVNSCSGLHRNACWHPDQQGSRWVNLEHFVTYVCDDADILLKIDKIIQIGVLGIQLSNVCEGEYRDKAGQVSGFATLDYVEGGQNKLCRSMCRQIKLPDVIPFDKIDATVWQFDQIQSGPHYMRHGYALAGCFGLGLNLLLECPSCNLTSQEVEKINGLMAAAGRLRQIVIKALIGLQHKAEAYQASQDERQQDNK